MSDKGAELNKRVWKLFEKAGFDTKPNSKNPNEPLIIMLEGQKRTPDLSANVPELGVKIIGENTTKKNLKKSFTTYVHDIEKLMGTVKAEGGLLVFTGIDVTEQNKRYAKRFRVRVWDEEELRYYEAVAEAIHEYAKYEIIHSFGIETTDYSKVDRVLAIKLNQPNSKSDTDLFLFTTTPSRLLKTCVVLRRAQGNTEAYQRILRERRLSEVADFVNDNNALLPTNIIVHFGENVTWRYIDIPEKDKDGKPLNLGGAKAKDYELVALEIPEAYASIELIDGQHRLYGFARADPTTLDNFNLVVLGIATLSPERRKDTFVAINDKARRVDPNLVAYLRYTEDEEKCKSDSELMAIKVVVELNKVEPFKKKVRLLDLGDHIITLKGFSGYDLKGLLGEKGLLRKYYPNNESKDYVNALRLYFNVLQSLFKRECQHPEKYIIFTNRGISAFLKLLKSILKTYQSPLDEDIVKMYLQPLKDKWPNRDWEIKHLKSAYVGSKGWKDFHRDLVATIREVYPDFRD